MGRIDNKLLVYCFDVLQKASILGFPTHAAYILDDRMAKLPERVDKFLFELKDKLQVLKQEEMDLFLSLKKEEVNNKLNEWIFNFC